MQSNGVGDVGGIDRVVIPKIVSAGIHRRLNNPTHIRNAKAKVAQAAAVKAKADVAAKDARPGEGHCCSPSEHRASGHSAASLKLQLDQYGGTDQSGGDTQGSTATGQDTSGGGADASGKTKVAP
ncbi:hypothetical protein C8F04DRAFT_1181713 [Mycena alexandri]|uniref:Uncharacterized protein n=1 Tax=Mycena alexandri TaxID=1745969 RepID=A0AAD6X4B1_9AGAR|nr:hypothetical protein C8F04DRAFT_1181713 [Mycena alexandri]